jgi:hypothetical protein
MIENCTGCRFWKRGSGEIGSRYGDCRRRAPVNVKTGGMLCEPYYAIFPATSEKAWCGEYESQSSTSGDRT